MPHHSLTGRRTTGAIRTCVAALSMGFAVSLPAQDSPHNPHVPPGPGPWFEGWYTRVSDSNGSRSVAVICASHLPKGQSYQPNASLPGYVNVLVSEGNGAPTYSYTAFPSRTERRMKGDWVRPTSDFSAPAEFEWVAEGFGRVTESSVELTLPGQVSVQIETSDRIPWNWRVPEASPEGNLALLPVPLHWHVHSLGSQARYELTQWDPQGAMHRVEGDGYAHLEKNWQTEFPEGWVWVQGHAEGNRAQIVGSVADVKLSENVGIEPWIFGYRSSRLQWDFRFSLPGSMGSWAMDPCRGWFLFEARDAFRVLRIISYAPPGSYGTVSVPTENGFVANRGGESFSATLLVIASLRVPLRGGGVMEWPVDVQRFDNAALEFGNGFRCVP